MFSKYPHLLFILLFLIIVSAHDVLPESKGIQLWKFLGYFGIDVAMTPVTTDMFLMLEPSGDHSYYQRNIQFKVKKQEEQEISMEWSKIGFYEIKLPFLLMSEYVSQENLVKGFVHAICFQLTKGDAKIKSFKIEVSPLHQTDMQMGFNKYWSCD